MKTVSTLIRRELGGLRSVRKALERALPHKCCECARLDVPCLEPDGCSMETCEYCKPHKEYIETVLRPRIEQLERLQTVHVPYAEQLIE